MITPFDGFQLGIMSGPELCPIVVGQGWSIGRGQSPRHIVMVTFICSESIGRLDRLGTHSIRMRGKEIDDKSSMDSSWECFRLCVGGDDFNSG